MRSLLFRFEPSFFGLLFLKYMQSDDSLLFCFCLSVDVVGMCASRKIVTAADAEACIVSLDGWTMRVLEYSITLFSTFEMLLCSVPYKRIFLAHYVIQWFCFPGEFRYKLGHIIDRAQVSKFWNILCLFVIFLSSIWISLWSKMCPRNLTHAFIPKKHLSPLILPPLAA